VRKLRIRHLVAHVLNWFFPRKSDSDADLFLRMIAGVLIVGEFAAPTTPADFLALWLDVEPWQTTSSGRAGLRRMMRNVM
jgi:hypothetical protein